MCQQAQELGVEPIAANLAQMSTATQQIEL